MKNELSDEILSAIIVATNNFEVFPSGSMTTLMGWTPRFDKLGRPLNTNPNYISGSILIEDIEYYIVKKGWSVWIYDKVASYMYVMNKDFTNLVKMIDLTPDHINKL